MNVEQAKSIPLTTILERTGAVPVKQNQKEIWYKSPFRDENTASFHIRPEANIWYDFGEGKGGNGLDFVCAYLKAKGEDCTVPDALRWLRNMTAIPFHVSPKPFLRAKTKSWMLLSAKPLTHLALIRYLQQRGIPADLARKHLKEVHVRHFESGKEMFALGFQNEDGGYELRNPFFKSCVTPKTITFIRGTTSKPSAINIFEGFMDYLSAVIRHPAGVLQNDSICLNSVSCLAQALPYITGYGYQTLYSWMDNDTAGAKAAMLISEFVQTQPGLTHKKMNPVYKCYQDVNAWHVATSPAHKP